MDKKAVIISGFPGVGKSTAYTLLNKKLTVLDSDSSTFDKTNFPLNYVKHIKENINKADIIFVSSHESVRNALVDEDIHFTLYYPSKKRKKEFLKLYKERGNTDNFITYVNNNFDKFIDDISKENGYNKIILDNENDFIMNNSDFKYLINYIEELKKKNK